MNRKHWTYLLAMIILASCVHQEVRNETRKNKPTVEEIYPTADTLPENLLRFYIQFSKSMKTVNNLENIKLLNEEDKEVQAIFNNVYELWDVEQKQLTLILDPARVKTGLVANQTLGRALEPDKRFKLVVESAEDIYGNQLERPFTKYFFVTSEDKEIPDMDKWQIIAPKPGNTAPLGIIFPQVLDRQSLHTRMRLITTNHELVEGRIEVTNQEKSWHFYPKLKWKKGIYVLQINSRLEDPAGNNMNGLFDHGIGGLKSDREGEVLELEVEIR